MTLEPNAVRDAESILRMFPEVPAQFENGVPTAAIFRPKGRDRSVFVEERLPGGDPRAIHVERFATWGHVRLAVGAIRQTAYEREGRIVTPFDVGLDPEGIRPPLMHCREAHAVLEGPNSPTACEALLRLVLGTEGAVTLPAVDA